MKAHKVAFPVLAAVACSSSTACDHKDRPGIDSEIEDVKIHSVQLVDPQTWYSESDFFGADSGIHYRVELETAKGPDTVPDVLVLQPPVVSRDSSFVSGIAVEPNDIISAIFTYEPRNESLELNDNPGPGFRPYSELALSPSGEYLAYLANDRNYHFWLVVLSWPQAKVLVETPRVETRCTEFWGNAIRWVNADSLELYMNLCDDEQWARASGSPSAGTFNVDTVGIEVLESLRPSQ